MYGNHGYGGAEYGGLKSTITRAAVALVVKYNIRMITAKALVLKYNVRLLIQKTLTILYGVGGPIRQSLTIIYRIFAWKPQEDGTKSYISQE